jgi:hypothetical protein
MTVWDDKCMNQRKVKKLVERFKAGLTSIVDDAGSGQSWAEEYGTLKEQIDQRIRDNRRIRTG